ncbi:MAG: hypothetical protein Q4A54_06415 [Parabacteroides sp.]|nr:hypothetical protein [Parabacteroides sp.]
MDTKDILKSLTTLEQNLKNIDSARQQVLNTVNAYEGTRAQLAKLAPELQSISEQLTNVFNQIKDNQTSLKTEVSKNVKTIFANIKSEIDGLDNATQAIQSSFKTSCDDTSRKLTETINKSRTLLDEGTEKAIKRINDKAKAEIENLTNLLSTFKTTTKNIQDNFQTSTTSVHNDQKAAQTEIVSNFKQAIEKSLETFTKSINELNTITTDLSNHKKDIVNDINAELQKVSVVVDSISTTLMSFKNDNETQYTDLINKLKSLRDGNVKAANNLSERFNKTDNTLSEIKALISEREKKVNAEFAAIKESNAKLSKLIIISIVAASLSIIIGVMGII